MRLLCVIDVFSKYGCVVPLKDKEGITIINAFQKMLKESVRKPNKIWADKGSEFYNNFLKKLLKDDIVNKYNDTVHRTIKTKPIDVVDNTHIGSKKEVNDEDRKFKVGNHVRISKYKNIFAKRYTVNLSEDVYVVNKI